MLIVDDDTSWLAITQPAHAYLAGQIAQAWADPLEADVVLGIQQHDIAWTEYDRTPPLHAPGRRAASFYEAPVDERLAIWRNVSARLDAQSPYAAVLVSLHATNIHTRYIPEEHRPLDLLAEARAEQDALLAVMPHRTRAQAEADADLLFALDALSLMLCHGWDGRELPGIGITATPAGDRTVTLDPWPLRVPELIVTLDARRLTERFDDAVAMHAALAAAPRERLSWTLRPA